MSRVVENEAGGSVDGNGSSIGSRVWLLAVMFVSCQHLCLLLLHVKEEDMCYLPRVELESLKPLSGHGVVVICDEGKWVSNWGYQKKKKRQVDSS